MAERTVAETAPDFNGIPFYWVLNNDLKPAPKFDTNIVIILWLKFNLFD